MFVGETTFNLWRCHPSPDVSGAPRASHQSSEDPSGDGGEMRQGDASINSLGKKRLFQDRLWDLYPVCSGSMYGISGVGGDVFHEAGNVVKQRFFVFPQTVWPHWVLTVRVKALCSIEVVGLVCGIFLEKIRAKWFF